jgi:hypothetical protein
VRRISRDVEVDMEAVEDRAVDILTIGKETAADSVSPGEDEQTWSCDSLVGQLERACHIAGDRASQDNTVRMAWACNEVDAEATDVEVDVTRRVEFQFGAAVAAGGDLTELERAAEETADLSTDSVRVDKVVFWADGGVDDELLPIIGAHLVVL